MSDWSQPGGEPQDPNQAYQQPYQQGSHPQGQYPEGQYQQYQQYQQYAQPYGAGPSPYAPVYGYPSVPPGERRPGSLTAAAVLGYVCGGLLILAAILLFFGASIVTRAENDFASRTSYGPELAIAGVANVIAAGLLIAGGVSMTGRNMRGRSMYVGGSAIVLVATVYWIARWAPKGATATVTVYALIFAALVIIGLGLAYTREDSAWLAGRPRR